MRVSAAHVQMPDAESANAILDEQEALDNRLCVLAFLPPDRFENADAIARTADALNAADELVRARGMELGYHNHNWEFSQQVGGQSAHALLFSKLAPTIFAEVDTYWAQVGGADPVAVVAGLGERAKLLHIKDGPADGPKSDMTAVGEGVVDVVPPPDWMRCK